MVAHNTVQAELMPEQILFKLPHATTSSLGFGLWSFSWMRNICCSGINTRALSAIDTGESEASTSGQSDSQVGADKGWLGCLG